PGFQALQLLGPTDPRAVLGGGSSGYQFLSRAAEAQHGSPNRRGTALYLLCQEFLAQEKLS
ncbi:MAG TPA: hypothetical protein VFR55_14000, partial [Dehalococcoidia bacterium]|nr:hypothetical protein [Dehalococcoidia bacterium]